MLRTIRPENPRGGQTGNLIPTTLLALVVCLCLYTGAGLQTDTSPQDGSTTEAPGNKDQSNDHESSGADASDPSPLAEHRQTINRLLDKRNFGPAMNRAFAMRRKLDGKKRS